MARRRLQQPGGVTQPGRQLLVAGRCSVETTLRPDPESRGDGEGLQARSAAQSAESPGEQAEAENFLTSALRQLFAVAEDYPELRASENFQGLQAELSETENRISVSRQIYNDTVLTYNNKVQQVPTNIVASMFGFGEREFFEAGDQAEEAPAVEF
jgi:LemA protein